MLVRRLERSFRRLAVRCAMMMIMLRRTFLTQTGFDFTGQIQRCFLPNFHLRYRNHTVWLESLGRFTAHTRVISLSVEDV